MNGCRQIASTCNGLDVRPVLTFLRRVPRPLCQGCRDAMTAAGASFEVIERRERAVPVTQERRRGFRPAWLRNLVGRDETGRLVA